MYEEPARSKPQASSSKSLMSKALGLVDYRISAEMSASLRLMTVSAQ
jgi:hypothetical protein